jgi:hypothetical protein
MHSSCTPSTSDWRLQGEFAISRLTLNGFNWAKMVRAKLLHLMICRVAGECMSSSCQGDLNNVVASAMQVNSGFQVFHACTMRVSNMLQVRIRCINWLLSNYAEPLQAWQGMNRCSKRMKLLAPLPQSSSRSSLGSSRPPCL